MKLLNGYKMRLLLVVVMAVAVLSGRRTKADFTFGEPTNLGPQVNSRASECFSTISSDRLELYFMDPYGPLPGGLGGWDIWVVKRPSASEPWGTPVNPGPSINSESDDAKPSISADGLTLYFGSTRPGGYGGYDLWMSTRASLTDNWSEAENLGETINGSADEAFPCISKDGLELYFSGFGQAGRPGGYGDADIWVTKRATTEDSWGEPVNLGEAINSPDYDSCPYLSSDCLMLFFHSLRPGGPGFENMLVSTRPTASDAWGTARFLPTPINSTANEGVAGISADGLTFYYSSDRAGGEGHFDIWQAPLLPIVDFNGDGIIDSADMCIIVDHWGEDYPLCDVGLMPWGDGIVDVQDLIVLTEHLFEEVYDSTLVAHWPLDETEGMFAADTVGSNNAIVIGGTTWQPDGGQVNGALKLDGVSGYAITGFALNPAEGPFSIIAWIKGDTPGQVIVSQQFVSNWLATDTDGNLMTELKSSDSLAKPLLSETFVTDGQWHRVGLVWDGSHRTLYVDGVKVAEETQDGLGSSESGLNIGAGKMTQPGTFFSGLIDDVRIYNRVVAP